jgi:hypothetical protein
MEAWPEQVSNMATWTKVKNAVCGWCKKYWQILVGFFGALFAVFAISGGNKEARKILSAKNEMLQKEEEAIAKAREAETEAIKNNIEKYFEVEDEAMEALRGWVDELDEQKRTRVLELLESDNPEEEIAAGLRRFLE